MCKKMHTLLILCLIFSFACGVTYSLDELTDKLEVNLISPTKPNAKLAKSKVDTKPVVVRGVVPVEIGKVGSKEDIQNQRYLVEYFIDGDLAYKIDGSSEKDAKNTAFKWLLDTTKYRNGKHKLVVNFWDKEGSSEIGILYIIVDNPLSIEDIKEVTAGE